MVEMARLSLRRLDEMAGARRLMRRPILGSELRRSVGEDLIHVKSMML